MTDWHECFLKAHRDNMRLLEKFREKDRKVQKVIKEWLHTPTLLLRAGEMSAQEIRTVKAVLKAVLRGVENAS